MTGLFEDMMEKHTIDIPLGGGLSGLPGYRGRFGTDKALTKGELNGLFDLPFYRVSPKYMAQFPGHDSRDPFVGYEDGNGRIYIADGLTPLQERVTRGHEGIGSMLSRKGYPHDDPTIARFEAEYFLGKGDMEAFAVTARGARNKGWISHDEFLNYMKTAYETGTFRG